MSFKLNQADPTRRQRILDRRLKGAGTDVSKLPKDKYDRPVFRPKSDFRVGASPSFMSMKNRRACLRYLAKRVNAGQVTPEESAILAEDIIAGTADRSMVYGFKPR